MRTTLIRCLGLLLVAPFGPFMFLANGHAQKQNTTFSPTIPEPGLTLS